MTSATLQFPPKEETLLQNATAADSWSNPDMEPVPMAPLPIVAPPNQTGLSEGAGPAAEGLADGPIAHRLHPSIA